MRHFSPKIKKNENMTKWLYPYLYVTDDDFLNWCTILLNIKFHSKKKKERKKKKKSEQRNKPLLFRNKKVTTFIYNCYEKLCENYCICNISLYNLHSFAYTIVLQKKHFSQCHFPCNRPCHDHVHAIARCYILKTLKNPPRV